LRPTRLNIHEAEAVIDRALSLGAFRFNTGRLMRIGTAARLWGKLEPTAAQYRAFRGALSRRRSVNASSNFAMFRSASRMRWATA
jgi:MoaA/NifB/PqqE/SkfB family radical SAM enzyme